MGLSRFNSLDAVGASLDGGVEVEEYEEGVKDSVGVEEGMKDVLEDRVTVKEKDASLFVGGVMIVEGEAEGEGLSVGPSVSLPVSSSVGRVGATVDESCTLGPPKSPSTTGEADDGSITNDDATDGILEGEGGE